MEGGNSHIGAATTIFDKPLLKTVQTKIDVQVDTLTMEFGNFLMQFNILDTIKHLV